MAKVAIDLDGVLADFFSGFNEVAMKLYPSRGITHDTVFNDWNFNGLFTEAELGKIWQKIRATPNFWLGLDAHHDNVGHLARWLVQVKEHDIYFVTARPETAGMTVARQTDWWLRACGLYPLMNYFAVIAVDGADAKAPIYLNMGVRWSIDDKEETVAECNKLPGHHAFLQGRPWNVQSKVGPRVKHIGEFLSEVPDGRKG